MSSARPAPLRVHLKPVGRSFAACSTAPQTITTRDPAEVTCVTCSRALRERWERTRELPLPDLANVGRQRGLET
jgi:hypothetical protein